MKVFDTRIEQFPFKARVQKDEDGTTVQFIDEANQVAYGFKLDGCLDNSDTVGSRELCDCMNLYIFITDNGIKLVSKYEDTYFTKANGFIYSRVIDAKQTIGGQIYVPFKDAGVDEWSLRLNSNEPIDIEGDVDLHPEVFPATLETFHDVVQACLPSLSVVSVTPQAGGANKVLVQVTLDGQPVQRSGVKVYAKSANGYIAARELTTNDNGQVEFLARRLDLTADQEMVAEFGFKFKTNIANVAITQ